MNPRAETQNLKMRSLSTSSISSADMPLAKLQNSKRSTKGRSKAAAKAGQAKGTRKETDGRGTRQDIRSSDGLSDTFLHMIRDDSALWLRILRYEVSSFVEHSVLHGYHADSYAADQL
jgi:hypothetical protein